MKMSCLLAECLTSVVFGLFLILHSVYVKVLFLHDLFYTVDHILSLFSSRHIQQLQSVNIFFTCVSLLLLYFMETLILFHPFFVMFFIEQSLIFLYLLCFYFNIFHNSTGSYPIKSVYRLSVVNLLTIYNLYQSISIINQPFIICQTLICIPVNHLLIIYHLYCL